MDEGTKLLEQARLVVQRLERVSADSPWARRSSGLRGALLKWIERLEKQQESLDQVELQSLIEAGYQMLERAAKERLR